MGAQGPTLIGPPGAAGSSGLAGAQGQTGATGAQGSTTTGAIGAVGQIGDAGAQGAMGVTGAQGQAQEGLAGSAGSVGEAGIQGLIGAKGTQGAAGVLTLWTLIQELRFDYDQSDLKASETKKVSEIAKYLKSNPSLKIAIDGSLDIHGSDPKNQELSDRRVKVIREAMIQSGVPSSKIQLGAFGDPLLTRDRRVAVLVRTDNE
jgi:outer membrane protein OmpA-like peptidoglycan-associated protein